MSKWHKLGKIIEPQRDLWWMQTHAMLPTPYFLQDDIWRIYFSGRNEKNQSHIGYADVDVIKQKVVQYGKNPVLKPGELGCFDDSGVTPSCIVKHKDELRLYYIGWQLKSSVRMSLVAGLALSKDNGKSFKRYSRGPLLERTNDEPLAILTAPFVLKEKNLWRMWYVSGIRWINQDLPQYDIKYAESKDGISWDRQGQVAIPLKRNENALARPWIIKDKGIYKMWFAYKGENYRPGYAESKDGINWIRKNQHVGINISETGFDSQMLEYEVVFKHKDKYYMFYNGNTYGATGIGWAVSS